MHFRRGSREEIVAGFNLPSMSSGSKDALDDFWFDPELFVAPWVAPTARASNVRTMSMAIVDHIRPIVVTPYDAGATCPAWQISRGAHWLPEFDWGQSPPAKRRRGPLCQGLVARNQSAEVGAELASSSALR